MATDWPDPTTGLPSSSQEETVTVNALGQTATSTDRNGTTHTLSYDVHGRVVNDAVTTLGAGVDGAVRRVETAYDGPGNPYLVTSYDAATGGTVVNQVERAYNGLRQLVTEYQEHGGAVNTSTSPKVRYAYSEMPSGADHSRLASITYPSGYVLTYNYSSGINDPISRLSSLSDSTGTLEGYSYLGLGTVVIRSHPQPGIDLTYVKQGGESNGDAGDQYTGLDRFGRVVDQRWIKTSTGTATDRFRYTYDRDGNRLTRGNPVNPAFDETYTYDGLNQLASFARGSHTRSWDYDSVGNFDGVTTNGGTPATRTHNAQNEITSIGGATTPAYDANGNMTGDETGKTFVYDAWNRLVGVKSGSTTLETFQYDGLNRRIVEDSGTARDLYYSSSWQVLEEKVGSNTTARYVWSPVYVDAIVLRDRDTDANGTLDERLWAQQDANWNVTAIMDGSGVVQERYVYDPYGSQTIYSPDYSTVRRSSSYDVREGFQGMFFDSISGTYKSRDRTDYSPSLGRPLQADPLGLVPDVNDYRWEGNGTPTHLDSTGLADQKDEGWKLISDTREKLGDEWQYIGADYSTERPLPARVWFLKSNYIHIKYGYGHVVEKSTGCGGAGTKFTWSVTQSENIAIKMSVGGTIGTEFEKKGVKFIANANWQYGTEWSHGKSETKTIEFTLPSAEKDKEKKVVEWQKVLFVRHGSFVKEFNGPVGDTSNSQLMHSTKMKHEVTEYPLPVFAETIYERPCCATPVEKK